MSKFWNIVETLRYDEKYRTRNIPLLKIGSKIHHWRFGSQGNATWGPVVLFNQGDDIWLY